MSYLDDLFSLKGKIAIVTGAARGNGKAISEALLKSGATVILVDILKNELSKVVTSFHASRLDAFMFHCDITVTSEILNLRKFVIGKFNHIDILVNNAGVTHGHDILNYPDESWDNTYKVNLKAPFELSKEFGKFMKKQKSGVIINVTSINAELAFPNNPSYVAFKGGLKQLSKSLALDLGKYGIRVNNLGPGYFRTDMTKKSWTNPKLNKQRRDRTVLGRWGEPNDLAGIVILLASNASSYITGQDFYVDGGWLIKGL